MTMGHTDGKCPGTLGLYFVCIALCCPALAWSLEVSTIQNKTGSEKATVTCTIKPYSEDMNVTWMFNGEPLKFDDHRNISEPPLTKVKDPADNDGNMITIKTSTISIVDATRDDAGNYTCLVEGAKVGSSSEILHFRFPCEVIDHTAGPVKHNVTDPSDIELYCTFKVYEPPKEVIWRKDGVAQELLRDTNFTIVNITTIKSIFKLNTKNSVDGGEEINGKYTCEVEEGESKASEVIDVMIYARPKIIVGNATAISPTEIFINWTVKPYNSNIVKYNIVYMINNDTQKRWVNFEPDKNATSAIISQLHKSTEYTIEISVITDYGPVPLSTSVVETFDKVKTLDEDPSYVPVLSINGFSATSVTLGLGTPPEKTAHLIHYYILEAKKKGDDTNKTLSTVNYTRDNKNLPYMFGNLDPYSTYIFRAKACSEFIRERCGNWSLDKEAATLDGIPGVPKNVAIAECGSRVMRVTWEPPERPNAEIKGYTLELTGNATYTDRYGTQKEAIWGPLTKFMTNDSKSVWFSDLQPNTNYTIRLSAMTRMRRRGKEEVLYCQTEQVLPDTQPRPRWRKIQTGDKYMFKMYLPRISERNGRICCYRVYMIRLRPNQEIKNFPQIKNISIISYDRAHGEAPVFGAYITDVFTNDDFPKDSEVVMGDDTSIFDLDRLKKNLGCEQCLIRPKREHHEHHETTTQSTTPSTTTEAELVGELVNEMELATDVPELAMTASTRKRRDIGDGDSYKENDVLKNSPVHKPQESAVEIEVKDGPLDSGSNYTLFVELIVPNSLESLYSDYVNALMPAPTPAPHTPLNVLEIALQVTCGIAALVLVCMIAFCVLQTRRSRKLPQAPLEMNPVFRYIVEHLVGRPPQAPLSPPDMPPIAREDLAAAYAERQLDSDYGFQKEFELLQLLPDCFNDRTTHASEAKENQGKNRYPDIKAYDQTRVKLQQVDGLTGSDYINANYVCGYRERKEFICAQGPTDTTVNDFWRMIWEHGLELIVMLTNLEEYSKVKCSKYWPDELRGSRNFGSIAVHHVSEKRYSDYIVRELKITKTPVNSEGQPIVENNGIAKRNGDCGGGGSGSGTDSAPTSPRETKEEFRLVRQYHFLMWKDFAAPEHPHSILKFIKRVNEAWSNMVGRPVVVHCSAGVGRTGTLVALDCLIEQLRATGHAAVFNTICELRRQRNFLVQSLKQYVFVYRALVEYAHYGDTEIPASKLKSAIDRLRNTPEGADKCLMEVEFEKIINSPVTEPVKSCAAGAGEEVRARNRSQDCLPYDRNRVILTPIPGRDFSTYINASFIEAYDNSEGFIITQDPLPNTIADFWRMVEEHNVSTIVMLSELGEGKCPRYWDDGTAQYENISVQYEESESCPYYTRRQFRLTDNRNGEVRCVRQLQYQGWPTAPGHVPEVTRGLAELADAAQPAATPAPAPAQSPMLVHCLYGTERSSLFVALCILISQLRIERRVDVNSVARKVRSQRARTIDTFLQYEFLHRAILNYAELHNLLEDS